MGECRAGHQNGDYPQLNSFGWKFARRTSVVKSSAGLPLGQYIDYYRRYVHTGDGARISFGLGACMAGHAGSGRTSERTNRRRFRFSRRRPSAKDQAAPHVFRTDHWAKRRLGATTCRQVPPSGGRIDLTSTPGNLLIVGAGFSSHAGLPLEARGLGRSSKFERTSPLGLRFWRGANGRVWAQSSRCRVRLPPKALSANPPPAPSAQSPIAPAPES